MTKHLKLMFFLVIALIFALIIRSFFEQRHYFSEAQSQKSLEAVKSYEKVILFHFPFSPYTSRAIKRISDICTSYDENEKKLYCYETLRSGLVQIKSFYQPYEKTIKAINPEIAKLRARLMIEWDKQLTESDFDRLYHSQLNLLSYDNAPNTFWSFVAVLSLFCWIGFVIYGIYKNKVLGFLGFVFFFILWIVGLYLA